ncbi:band 4.1-like protein 4 [Montipora capricornis]|uniref:band 4.1-like protein 4 n=1 Tax=Montipora foliosa TaxID=591990 RepID=UPI0035F1CAE5
MSWFRRNTVWFCHVLLLDESEHPVEIRRTTKGDEVLEKVFKHLNLLERDYFGLRYIDGDSQSRWLDPMKPVVKQLKAGPPYLLYFCVKFYAADPCRLHEELTRYLFFLQVKKDIYQGRLPCATNVLAEISAYSIQSELGEYDPKEHTLGYVSEFRFLPNQSEELESKIFRMHKKLGPMVPSVAEFMYLDKIKWLEMYGVDLHPVKGEDFVEYFVALKPSGVAVYKNKTRVGSYVWSKIEKVDFNGKKFYLSVKGKEDHEFTFKFYLSTKSACKHLWKCCLEHHVFFRLDKSTSMPRRKSGLFRTSSTYRYSGRTQKEALDVGKKIQRSDPEVKRKPSKRYERRLSIQSVEKAVSNVTISATSTSQVQIKRFSQSENQTEVITVPVEGQNGTVTKTEGDPSSKNGDTTVDGGNQGPAMPWEQSAQMQGGLYTPAPDSPHSLKNTGSGRVKRSPKFPSPHRRSAQSSGSETDTPRRRSRRAYSSDDDTGRRRRRRCRHHHRGHHSAESGSDRDSSYSREERRRHRSSKDMEEFLKMSDASPYHWNENTSRKERTGSGSEGSHHHHHRHRHREADARSDGSASRHRHSKATSDDPDSGMVPALDVIHSRVSVARVKDGNTGRHRHHRHQRPSYHGYASSESGYSAVSVSTAPKSSQVLLELGPESSSPSKHGPGSAQTSPGMSTNPSSSFPRNKHDQQGLFASRAASLPRDGSSDKTGHYLKVEYPNGVIIHDTRNQGRIPNHVMYQAALQLNGTTRSYHNAQGKHTANDYIEVVSGPSKRGEPPPYYSPSPGSMINPSSKSTVL